MSDWTRNEEEPDPLEKFEKIMRKIKPFKIKKLKEKSPKKDESYSRRF